MTGPPTPPPPPPPPAPKYVVEYYQINGSVDSVGESAIILLVDKDPGKITGTKSGGEIQKVVLVDTGFSTFMLENIKKTMTTIVETFEGPDNIKDNILLFDAIVISHWDRDHYYAFSVNEKCLLTDKTIGFDSDAPAKKIQCFKYDDKMSPQTVLYCPWWWPFRSESDTNKDKGRLLLPDTVYDPNTDDSFLINYGTVEKNGTKTVIQNSILKGCCKVDQMLGLEIFGAQKLTVAPNSILTVDNLLTQNPPPYATKAPGLYIVGTRMKYLGAVTPNTFENVLPPNPIKDGKLTAIEDDLVSPKDMQPLVGIIPDNKKSAAKLRDDDNANCVLLLVIWKDPLGGTANECTFYSGGDAEYQTERNLCYWLKQSMMKVKIVKVGHHGSKSGTGSTLLSVMKPEHIVVSAGTQYGHPVPELVFYLGSWFDSTEGLPAGGQIGKRLHSVCHPYYFMRVKDGGIERPIECKYVSVWSYTGLPLCTSTDTQKVSQWKSANKKLTDFIALLQANYTASPIPFSTDNAANLVALQNKINEYTPSANLLKAQVDLKTAQGVVSTLESSISKQAQARDKGLRDAKEVVKTKEDVLEKAEVAEMTERFAPVISWFEIFWKKWSMIEYKYAAVGGQNPSEVIRYLHATLDYGKDPVWNVRATDGSVFTYPITVVEDVVDEAETDPTDPSKKSKPNDGGDPVGSNINSAKIEGKNIWTGKRRNGRVVPETRKSPYRYLLSLEDEAAILRLEGQNDLEYDDPGLDVDMADSQSQQASSLKAPANFQDMSGPASITTIRPAGDPYADSESLVVTNDDRLSHFLYTLLDGYMELEHAVTLDSVANATSILLKDDDGLRRWWQSIRPSASSAFEYVQTYAFLWKNGNALWDIIGLRLLVAFTNQQVLSYSSNQTVLQTYFQLPNGVYDSLLDYRGLLGACTGIVLAIEPDIDLSHLTLSLQDLFNIVAVNISTLLQAIASQVMFQIDNTQGVNALWYYPPEDHDLTYRICAIESPTSKTSLSSIFSNLFGFLHCSFDKFSFIGVKDCQHTYNQKGEINNTIGTACLHTGLHLTDDSTGPKWDAYFTVSDDWLEFSLRWNDSNADPLTTFLTWIGNRMSLPNGFFDPFTAMLSNTTSINNNGHSSFTFREASIRAAKTSNWEFQSFKISFELDIGFGVKPDPNLDHIPLLLTFSYTASGNTPIIMFQGQLWQTMTPTTQAIAKFDPDAPLVSQLAPLNMQKSQYFISIPDLLRSDPHSPSVPYPTSIPNEIVAASVTLSNQYVAFDCTVANVPSTTGNSDNQVVPYLSLDLMRAAARYDFGNPAKLEISFAVAVVLKPRYNYPILPSAKLMASIDFTESNGNSTWKLLGNLSDLSAASLYSLFPSSDNDAVMSALEEIYIRTFSIEYDYDSQGLGSKFSADGVLLLGPVELILDFQCNTSKAGSSGWSFDARLSPNLPEGQFLIGDILGGISPDIQALVPEFISSMSISFSANDDFIDLEVDKTTIASETHVTFSIIAKIGSFEFSFVQVNDSMPAGATTKKRLLRITLDRLPPITAVPLLQALEQPFDQMDFMWASEDLNRIDIDQLINPHFIKNHVAPIHYKDPKTVTSDPAIIDQQDTNYDVVITQGCHFMIVVQESNIPTVVLDHAFDGGQTQPPTPDDQIETEGDGGDGGDGGDDNGGDDVPPPTTGETSASSGVLTKKAGPLTISGIGLKYVQPDSASNTPAMIGIVFSATVMIGPIGGKLKNFAITFPISSIQSFDPSAIQVSIDGIGLEFNEPPISIAGELMHSPGVYSGGISIDVEPYNFLAGGSYGVPPSKKSLQTNDVVNNGNWKDLRSLFAFAEVDGPLVELEFASLSGLVGGFGYNNDVRIPTIDNVTTFPFLKVSTSNDPLQILDSYLNAPAPWFFAQPGPMWISAGLTAKAFHVLDITSAVLLDVTTDDVIFGLFADATATVPLDAKDGERFALVDMGLIALVDFAKGVVKVEGQLTPKSYILDKNCHLSGGFALEYFFEGSGHDGDWVFTIGGYHSQFQVPTWYPKPARVAITWKYDDNISIYGDAYFAVTPKSCMGGGSLNIAYRSSGGDLEAKFNAYADFLINYSPFSFLVDMGVSIDIVYHQYLIVTTKNWHIHFGASCHLWGPPVAGTVHIDWCIISFDINFGNSKQGQDALKWPQFSLMLAQNDPNVAILTVKTTGGVVPDASQPADSTSNLHTTDDGTTVVLVDPSTFSFEVASLVAATGISFNTTDLANDSRFMTKDKPSFKSMQISGDVTSTKLKVTVDNLNDGSKAVDFNYEPILKQVPRALWDEYTATTDPLKPTDATKTLLMGISLQTPNPIEGDDPRLVLDTSTALMEDIFGPGKHPSFNASDVSTEEAAALSTWLPQTNADAVLPETRPVDPNGLYPTANDWKNLQDQWTSPTRPMENLVSEWATLSGAVEGDALFTTYMTYGMTSAPPPTMASNLSTFLQVPPFTTPSKYTINPFFEIISAAWGASDATTAMQNELLHPNPNASKLQLDTVNHTLKWWPDYLVLGDPDPYNPKVLILVYRPTITYPSYGPTADVNPANVRTVRALEGSEMTFSYADDLSFTEPILDAYGRAIVSASYWNHDVTDKIKALSASSETLTVNVNGTDFSFADVPNVKVALTVTWATRRNGVWSWHMVWQELGKDLVIPSGL